MGKKRNSAQKNYSREAISFIMIALGIILLLSVLSYDRADDPNLKIAENSIKIRNLIGPAGAAVADPLMKYTLGYPILFLPILIIIMGIQLFRNRPLNQYSRPIILMTVWSFFLSLLFAFPEAMETHGQMLEYFSQWIDRWGYRLFSDHLFGEIWLYTYFNGFIVRFNRYQSASGSGQAFG